MAILNVIKPTALVVCWQAIVAGCNPNGNTVSSCDQCSLRNSEPGIRNSELVYFKEFEPLTALIVQFIPSDPNP